MTDTLVSNRRSCVHGHADACRCFALTVPRVCRYLEKAVAVVLGFIGGKMILDQVPGGYHVTTEASLAVVVSALSIGVGASLLLPESKEDVA